MDQPELNPERIRLGARLRAQRTAAGLSRQDVARFLQLPEGRIGAIERGTTAITAINLWRLAGRLGVPVASFFDPAPEGAAAAPTLYELMAASDDGADLAEAFAQLKTPRLRRHLVRLARELAAQGG